MRSGHSCSMYVLLEDCGLLRRPVQSSSSSSGSVGYCCCGPAYASAGRRLMIDKRRAARDCGPFAAWQHPHLFRWNNVSRPGTRPAARPTAIVVLGGAVTADIAAARNDVALNEAAERMTATVELARRYPNARIIFSGGDGSLVYGGNEV